MQTGSLEPAEVPMMRSVRRLVATCLVATAALVASAGMASAQTVTVTFGPLEIIQRVGQLTLTFEGGEIIEDGRVLQVIEGVELVIPLDDAMEVLEGEMYFYLPRQSFTYDAGFPTDGGTGGGGGGGGPDCGQFGCGG